MVRSVSVPVGCGELLLRGVAEDRGRGLRGEAPVAIFHTANFDRHGIWAGLTTAFGLTW